MPNGINKQMPHSVDLIRFGSRRGTFGLYFMRVPVTRRFRQSLVKP
jgi:hypothetical protein